MPSAPKRRARSASSPVSALARTRSRRTSSASAHDPVHRPHQVVGLRRVRVEAALEVLDHRRGHDRHLAGEDLARWSRRWRSRRPRATTVPSGAVSRRRLASTSSSSAPHTHVLPIPRATTAAWLVLPPRLVRMPCGGDHAVQVVGVGLPAHQHDLLPRPRPLHRRVGVEHRLADGRTRRGGDAPGRAPSLGPGGVELREHQLRQLAARAPGAAPRRRRSRPRRPAGRRSGTPRRRCACPPGSAASTACRARW